MQIDTEIAILNLILQATRKGLMVWNLMLLLILEENVFGWKNSSAKANGQLMKLKKRLEATIAGQSPGGDVLKASSHECVLRQKVNSQYPKLRVKS